MRDAVSIARVRALHPAVATEVFEIIGQIEAQWPATMAIRVVQGLRTIKEQNDLYAQGRTKPGHVVTNAKGGSSFHNFGLAIDFAILYDKDSNGTFEALSWDLSYDFDKDGADDWDEVVSAFKAKGWSWGGDWKSIIDNPHLEKGFGHTWRELLAKYNAGDFIHGTEYVNV